MTALLTTALAFLPAYVPPTTGTQPPGMENVSMIIQWVMWGASAVLFTIFLVSIVTAARANKGRGEADVAAPAWPIIGAIVLGGSAGIWAMF